MNRETEKARVAAIAGATLILGVASGAFWASQPVPIALIEAPGASRIEIECGTRRIAVEGDAVGVSASWGRCQVAVHSPDGVVSRGELDAGTSGMYVCSVGKEDVLSCSGP